ncbi:MAG TPA: heavy metal translocating P-type ATPase [Candidatus Saccharimonadales bacterium]|nr:heavy metal translocating P-type ATPase [Candidatus Saccharimonadales bacterium]
MLDISGHHTAAHWILGLSAIANVIPLLWDMIEDLRSGIYGVDILAATAIITSVLLHEYWAGIIIVLMLTGGEALEDYAERRAKSELTDLLKQVPTKAHVMKGRKVIDVAVSQIYTSDKIVIKPGEVVPVDAVILDGTASFDEASLTGESLPTVKNAGQEILSGSINLDGVITARALRSAKDSQFEQIIKLVKSAEASKSPFVRLADRYSIPFTLAAFTIGLAAWYISGQAIRFLEVMVVATPCPLILGAPIALVSGMSRAAKHGIIVKTGHAMERLAAVKTIGFDKTGTLTRGQPQVDKITTFNGFDVTEVLGIAAALEQNSNHVLAKAVVEGAKQKQLKLIKAKKVQELAGNGLSANVQGKHVLVGRLGLIEKYAIELPKNFKSSSVQQTAAFVAINQQLAGLITFKDELRPEAKTTLTKLRRMGIKHMLMVTGDNQAVANNIAKQLGIDNVVAETLPVDKLKAIDEIQNRPVAFVGDGVNDAPVLAAADVGIALGARGSTAASESADVVIMLDDVGRVATSVAIAKRTFFIAKQSIMIGIAISVGLMFVFATGRFKPIYGAIIQEVVDVIVIFNALRAHGSWRSTS